MSEIVTLTINPSIDVSTTVNKVEPLHKLRCSNERRQPGGGGVNVARVVRRFGGDVLASYATGGATGQRLRQLVANEGLESLILAISGDTRENFNIFEEATEREYRFILPGPRLSDSECRRCLEVFTTFEKQPRYVIASGSLPPGVPDDFYASIAERINRIGAKFVVDASGPALRAAVKHGVYLVKPSLSELQDLIGTELLDQRSWVEASRNLIHTQRTTIVALTLGSKGALLVTADRAWFAEAVPVKCLSAVGAGDSFLGAMVWALASGFSTEDAFRYGVAAGSAALLTQGTDLCMWDDVQRLLQHVKLQQI